MRKSRFLAAGAAVAAAVVAATLAPGSAAATGAPPTIPAITVKQVCTTGFFQCKALLRTDLPLVPSATAAHPGFGRADFLSAYKLPTTGGKGMTVAIVDAYDNPNLEADLQVYRDYYGLPKCTTANGCFKKINQDGGAVTARPDPLWALEQSLDVDMVSAVCPQCNIVMVEASSADETSTTMDKGADLPHAVVTAATLPHVVAISNSYGSVGVEPNEVATEDYEYNHPGIAVVVSAGDSGYEADYPATSQYVVAVGGTALTKTGGATSSSVSNSAAVASRGWSEKVWNNGVNDTPVPETFGATGSGCSMWEPKPAWQTDTGCTGRSEADVSAVADPDTGVAIYDTYPVTGTPITGWSVVGGTSASSPIVAGIYALAGNKGLTTSSSVSARYPAQRLWTRASNLNDVTVGQNFTDGLESTCSGGAYICKAQIGYDGPTGNGTPNGLNAFKP